MFFYLWTSLLFAIGLNLMFFIFAYFLQKDWFTDITYALTFLITNVFVVAISENFSLVAILIFVFNALWSLRIGAFLLIRVLKTKRDKRFDNIRNNFWKFLVFWILQAFSVWFINISNIINLALNKEINFFIYIPIFISLFGLFFETIADFQKFNWHSQKQKRFINKGLWKISRHPNYFGEIVFWIGTSLFLVVSNFEWIKLIGFISPIWIIFLINFVSGINLLEKRSYQKYQSPKYETYLHKTSCIIPFIGKKKLKDKWRN